MPKEAIQQFLAETKEPGRFADLVAGYIDLTHEKPAAARSPVGRGAAAPVLVHVQRQIGRHRAQEDIKSQVQEELGDRQREMFLREQLKAIQKELGEDDGREELEELREKLEALKLPEAARKEVDRELGRLERMGREAMEAQVIRTYLETIAELPWSARTDDGSTSSARPKILEEDHYGLDDVKDRVLEFLAVQLLHKRREAEKAEEVRKQSRDRRGRAGGGGRTDGRRGGAGGGKRAGGRGRVERDRPRRSAVPTLPGMAYGATRSCSSSARPASARRRSPSPSPAPWAASTSASPSAACATRPTSAATGAPTSAPCPDGSSRA